MPQKPTKIYQKRNFPYEKCLIPIKYLDSKQFIKASYSWNKKKSKKKNRRASPYRHKNRKKNLVEENFFFFIFHLHLAPKA